MSNYSIVDGLYHARGFPAVSNEHNIFMTLCGVISAEQFLDLWALYTTHGNQKDNMIQWAADQGIDISIAADARQQGIQVKDSE